MANSRTSGAPQTTRLTTDQVYTSTTTLTPIPEIGTLNLEANTDYHVTWFLVAQRTANVTAQIQLDVTNFDFVVGHLTDHNDISRIEEGVAETNIQFQSNDEPQLIKVETVIHTNAASVATLSFAQDNSQRELTHYLC